LEVAADPSDEVSKKPWKMCLLIRWLNQEDRREVVAVVAATQLPPPVATINITKTGPQKNNQIQTPQKRHTNQKT
jgi:hypothetical protein